MKALHSAFKTRLKKKATVKAAKKNFVKKRRDVFANVSDTIILMPEKLELANKLITGVPLPKEFMLTN